MNKLPHEKKADHLINDRNPSKHHVSAFFTARRIAFLALLTAACVVGRFLFTFLPNVQPMTAILLMLTLILSLPEALLVTGLSLVITNLFLGFGVWTIGQFISYTGILLIFYLLTRLPVFGSKLWFQAVISGLLGFVYGFIYSIFNYFLMGMTVFWPYWISGLSFDALHALGNISFYLILWPILNRVIVKRGS